METYNGNTSDITDNIDTNQENVVHVHPIISLEDNKDLGIMEEDSLKVSESVVNLPNIKIEMSQNFS